MLFNSWIFIGLVLATMLVYYQPVLKNLQIYILLIASFVFYAYDSFYLLILLLASGVVNAIASYGAKYRRRSRLYATTGVVVNLTLLALFKYGNLLSLTFLDIENGIGKFLCTLPLPLGISFYTFSGISLVVDAYRGRFDEEKGEVPKFRHYLKDTLLYICFFPKLLAGPIVKSKDFCVQIGTKTFDDIDWHFVFKSLVTGYFLKMVIADNLKDFTFWMAYPYFESNGTGSLLLMLEGFYN